MNQGTVGTKDHKNSSPMKNQYNLLGRDPNVHYANQPGPTGNLVSAMGRGSQQIHETATSPYKNQGKAYVPRQVIPASDFITNEHVYSETQLKVR